MIIFTSNKRTMSYNISILLDERRAKENGKFPVKLRVYNRFNKKVKLYSLNIDLSKEEFETIWVNSEGKNLRGNNNEMRLKLQAIETRANNEAKELTVFDFDKFETKLFRKSSDKNSVLYHFGKVIKENIKNGKIGTAESYKYTFNSLTNFSTEKHNCSIAKLTFNDISVKWLEEYENFMLSKGKSITTIAIYTRTLRVVFNNAIYDGDISKDIYPFGSKKNKKYKVKKASKVKKALNSKQLKQLLEAKTSNNNQTKAKDFWFFSFACNGMNIKDIALLRYSDINEDSFTYYRAKTFDKTAEKKAITIYLNDFNKSIIQKYGNENKNGYVFDILDNRDNPETIYKKIKNFTRFVNTHIKKLAKKNKLPEGISSYWARHSFATNSVQKGASMEFISEALNHSDLSVTKHYFAGFEKEAKKEFANQLMDF
jgi:site-specific recombinase XerD